MSESDQANDSEETASGITFHLTPVEIWETQCDASHYAPERFVEEGFIHCTDGEVELLKTANRYYRIDTREFVVLEVDLARVGAPAFYEDAAKLYPHVYGQIDRKAIVQMHRVVRGHDGSFTALGEPLLIANK